MSSSNVLYENFSINDIKLSEIRKNQTNSGKKIFINNKSKEPVLLEFPKMKVPFGLNSYEDEKTGRISYSISLSLTDEKVVNFLKSIDDYIVNYVTENSEMCLGKVMNETVIREALYTPIAKESKDPKYSPTMKVTLYKNPEGSFDDVYDPNGNDFDLNELQKGQHVAAILKLSNIWFVGTKFGVSVRLEQLLVFPQNKLKGFAFKRYLNENADTQEDEDEEFET